MRDIVFAMGRVAIVVMLAACGAGGQTPQVVTRGEAVRGIAIDDTDVYWSNVAFNVTMQKGMDTIERAALTGGAPQVLAMHESFPYQLAIDATSVYWIAYNFGGTAYLGTVPLAGGTVMTIPGLDTSGGHVASNGSIVVWTVDDASGGMDLLTRPAAGGTPTMLTHVTTLGDLTIDDTSVYICGGDGVASVPLAAGAPIQLMTDPCDAIASDAASLYVSTSGGTIVTLPKHGGSAMTLATVASSGALAVDGGYAYWLESRDSNATFDIRRVSTTGGSPETIADHITGNLGDELAVHASHVAWTQDDKLMLIDL